MLPISKPTRAEAWLAAAAAMQKTHARMYNVVLEIEEPQLATPTSRAIESRVDSFLRGYGAQPTHTVAETIFPAVEYRQGGMDAVYAVAKFGRHFNRSPNRLGLEDACLPALADWAEAIVVAHQPERLCPAVFLWRDHGPH